MTAVYVIGGLAAVAGLVLVLAARRRPRTDDGVAQFQRHISALSPEARREVIDRVRPARPDGEPRPRGKDV